MASIGNSTIVVTAPEFHTMYRSCFEGIHQPMYPSEDYLDVQRAINHLLIPDPEMRDQKILKNVETIKEIALRIPKPPIITQLEQAIQSIKQGKEFWQMLLEKRVQEVMLQSIKALQDDFKKCGVIDEISLIRCLADDRFFSQANLSANATPSSRGQESHWHFFRERDKTRKRSEQSSLDDPGTKRYYDYPNIYSACALKELSVNYPSIVKILEETRKYFTNKAKKGILIDDAIEIEVSLTDGEAIYRILPQLHYISDVGNVSKPHCITMKALVYDEIMHQRIRTREEGEKFISDKFTDTHFSFYNIENTHGIDKNRAIAECIESLDAFEEVWNTNKT